MRSLSYDGSMEFDALNDSQIRANYQHKHVVDHYIKHFKNKLVLDAGCWTGTLEKEVSSRNWKSDMVGIDLNKDALTVAKKNFPQYQFHQVELAKPSPQFVKKYSNKFDTIVFLDVIEHVPPGTEVRILQLFNKLLKPGGHLIVSTMLSHRYNFIDPAWFLGHRHYSSNHIKNFLESSNFKVKELLEIGNLYWDIDILMLYIYKHIFRANYKTSNWMYKKIFEGLEPPQKNATRIYVLSQKSKVK